MPEQLIRLGVEQRRREGHERGQVGLDLVGFGHDRPSPLQFAHSLPSRFDNPLDRAGR
jgi:hypothetical protein